MGKLEVNRIKLFLKVIALNAFLSSFLAIVAFGFSYRDFNLFSSLVILIAIVAFLFISSNAMYLLYRKNEDRVNLVVPLVLLTIKLFVSLIVITYIVFCRLYQYEFLAVSYFVFYSVYLIFDFYVRKKIL